MRARVWRSGERYLTTLPAEWVENYAKEIKKKEKYEVERTKIGDLLFISAPFDSQMLSEIKLVAKYSDEVDIKMKLVTAYLQGFNVVNLVIRGQGDLENIESEIKRYILGTEIKRISNFQFRVEFPKEYNPVDKIIDSTIRVNFGELHSIVSDCLEYFNHDSSVINTKKVEAEKYEKDLDTITFIMKHNFNLALSHPELYLSLGINNLKDLIYYSIAISYFERAADLHYEIVDRLEKMLVEKIKCEKDEEVEIKWPNIKPLKNLYEEAYNILEDAIDGYRDRRRRLNVIEGKLTKWKTYEGFYYKKEEVKKWIKEIKDLPSVGVRHLTILEGKIKAIPYLAVNLSEAFDNMDKEVLGIAP